VRNRCWNNMLKQHFSNNVVLTPYNGRCCLNKEYESTLKVGVTTFKWGWCLDGVEITMLKECCFNMLLKLGDIPCKSINKSAQTILFSTIVVFISFHSWVISFSKSVMVTNFLRIGLTCVYLIEQFPKLFT
jgi:hypothetical protein